MTPEKNIDLSTTTSVETPNGNVIFQSGFILRKVSKFIINANEDGVMPVPIFFDPISNKILGSTLPTQLRKEYEQHTF